VPRQSHARDVRGETFVEDALLALHRRTVVVLVVDARWPTLVGGSCSGSPTMITWLPRAMAPMASQTGICEASSKITTSNGLASAGRYCAIESGLIIMQGTSWVMTFGIRPKSWRSGMCRAFLLISRASVPHSGSLPKLVWVGTEAPILAVPFDRF
jgi:hypothetical protein